MSKYGGLSLAEVLAQIVHYMHNDYHPAESETVIPEDVIWSCSYCCACFLAQHTNDTCGVETDLPYEGLKIRDPSIPYAERVILATALIDSLGGLK